MPAAVQAERQGCEQTYEIRVASPNALLHTAPLYREGWLLNQAEVNRVP